MKNLTLVSGLYRNICGGILNSSKDILLEIEESVKFNPHYKTNLVCYTDTVENARFLQNVGCYVHKVFDNAPQEIVFDTKHKMKHWIMFNAVQEFKDVLWIDWDTFNVKKIDDIFIRYCLSNSNPKFTWINNYWATVNCAVYYLNEKWLSLMEQSFNTKVEVPNDELLWKEVLPCDVRDRKDFWLNDYVVNIWTEDDFNDVTANTYFLHLKDFSMLNNNLNMRRGR